MKKIFYAIALLGALFFQTNIAVAQDTYSLEGSSPNVAVYIGDTNYLPSKVTIISQSNGSRQDVDVNWVYRTITNADLYKTLSVSGEVVGYELSVTATVEVIPNSGLLYYIDAGATGQPSSAFDAVKAKLAKESKPALFNDAPDRFFDENKNWGFVGKSDNGDEDCTYEISTFDSNEYFDTNFGGLNQLLLDRHGSNPHNYGMKLLTGYVGLNPVEEKNRLEYQLYLPAGEYEIITGHFSFFNNKHRPMQISFNGATVGSVFECEGNKTPTEDFPDGIGEIGRAHV
jgi:hypothetical protein